MAKGDYTGTRKSFTQMGEVYFWTATINKWEHLLREEQFKNIIIQSLDNLSERKLIDVFAFTIMPDHIHLIWRINALNGKETAQGSFLKFTAHELKKLLKDDPQTLEKYAVSIKHMHEVFVTGLWFVRHEPRLQKTAKTEAPKK